MKVYHRLSAPGSSALSLWELHGLRADFEDIFGSTLPSVESPLRLNRHALPFDEALLWCRQAGKDLQDEWVLECHLHGGYGVAAAFREWMAGFDWVEQDSNMLAHLHHRLMFSDSPLAARILASSTTDVFQSELERLRKLSAAERADSVQQILQWNDWADVVASPPQIVLAGPPDVGKSSIFNLWNRAALATTMEGHGTTRDPVHAKILMGEGVEQAMFALTDSAGLGDARSDLDRMAMEMSVVALKHAWAVVWILDAAVAPPAEVFRRIRQRSPRDIVVLHRVDLESGWNPEAEGVHVDLRCHLSEGQVMIQRLETAILKQIGPPPPAHAIVAASDSQRQALFALQD